MKHITKHARKRLKERTRLSLEELARLLDVSPVIEPLAGLTKEYVVIYSKKDKKVFLAIRDQLDGSIISIWHKYFYEKREGKIDRGIEVKAQLAMQRLDLLDNRVIKCEPRLNYGLHSNKNVSVYVTLKDAPKKKKQETLVTFEGFNCYMGENTSDFLTFARNIREKNILTRLRMLDIPYENVKHISIKWNKIQAGVYFKLDELEKINPREIMAFLRKRYEREKRKSKDS